MTSNELRREKRYHRRKTKRLLKKLQSNKQYDSFENMIDPDKLLKAFYSCRKGVAWKSSVQKYEANLMRNIVDAINKLENGENVVLESRSFKLNERGKIRDIKSIHISERVIQKALCDYILVPILSKTLIHDNGASIKGKGTKFTRKRLSHHLSKYYREYGNEGYILTVDFSKYFENINHSILISMLEKEIVDTRVLRLIKMFINSFGDKGLFLGSQVSQIFAVYYASRLDHYIKEKLRVRFYGRYMDDSYIISNSKEYLRVYLFEIEKICKDLGIILNRKKTQISKINKGFKFLKCIYILTDTGRIVKKPSKDNIVRTRRKLKKLQKILIAGKITYKDIRALYMSWKGYIKEFNSWRSRQRMHSLYYNLFVNKN